ncbi:MAG: arsenate reductase (azurin) small subunit [Deltaproteobacteria bacterium]|nr:arsenate reductase (azurin) small subunit [Deltaproteobacteria bacterium]
MRQSMQSQSSKKDGFCVGRRAFLLGAGATVTALMLPLGGRMCRVSAATKAYPRKVVGKLSALKVGEPQPFLYPIDDPVYCNSLLVKLGVPAGGGVGPQGDVVGFNTLCPHWGGLLAASYKQEHQVLGPCPTHLSTFDLTRHGMVVAGHSTESLPQVLLEAQGDEIVAVGVLGLIFGHAENPGGA